MNPFFLTLILAFIAIVAGFLCGCSITTDGTRTTYTVDGEAFFHGIEILADK